MIATRDCAGDSAGGIAAESVGHEPFAVEQKLARHVRAVPRHRANHRLTGFKLLVHPLLMQTAGCVSPIFFVSVDGAELFRVRAAARWSLPPVKSNRPVSPRLLFQVRRRKPSHSTREFPIPSPAVVPRAVPVRG